MPLELNQLYLMDGRQGMKELPKGSVDIIFTDPPYVADQWEEAYGILAKAAPRILRPSGFLFTYAPQFRLPPVMNMILEGGLGWFWIILSLNPSQSTALVHQKNAICMHKPILVFQKPPERKARQVFRDVVMGYRQKAFHPWQQSIHDVLGILSRFAIQGELICDPFAGTGTSLLAAKLLGLRWVGFEIDMRTYRMALYRLAQEPLDVGALV